MGIYIFVISTLNGFMSNRNFEQMDTSVHERMDKKYKYFIAQNNKYFQYLPLALLPLQAYFNLNLS